MQVPGDSVSDCQCYGVEEDTSKELAVKFRIQATVAPTQFRLFQQARQSGLGACLTRTQLRVCSVASNAPTSAAAVGGTAAQAAGCAAEAAARGAAQARVHG